MLNSKQQRELCYVVTIDEIKPIPNYDKVEYARTNGWWVIVQKNQFKVGDPAIYFEIDSKTPKEEPFTFLEKRHYKIKTLKMCKVLSQGLLMAAEDFGWVIEGEGIMDSKGVVHIPNTESAFLTQQLGVTYADAEDNKRKANSVDKYKKMASRHPNLFKKKPIRWLMKWNWGKKLLFVFFGKKKDKKGNWPVWVTKTDEERCQNMPFLFTDPDWHDIKWIATEKIDGSSTTFTMRRKNHKKMEFHICSRNVCFDSPEKSDDCYYSTNIYIEMAKQYHIEEAIKELFMIFDPDNTVLDFITIQGETYGDGVQKRTYSVPAGTHSFMAFNLIFGFKDGTRRRCNPIEMTRYLEHESVFIPCVPIINTDFVLPATCEELLEIATGKSQIDGLPREGIVFRDNKGERSFKAVSNEFLIQYHQ